MRGWCCFAWYGDENARTELVETLSDARCQLGAFLHSAYRAATRASSASPS